MMRPLESIIGMDINCDGNIDILDDLEFERRMEEDEKAYEEEEADLRRSRYQDIDDDILDKTDISEEDFIEGDLDEDDVEEDAEE